jgi:hypothetical protein
MLALPGATRAHHMLNLAPFVQLLVAAQLVRLFDRGGTRRAGAAVLATLVLAADARSIAATRALIERTGGRGYWSDAIAELASELEAEPQSAAVSLDWGFHLQLLFTTTRPTVLEPFWRIARDVTRDGEWTRAGGPSFVYLAHDELYDRFGYGPRFLQAARALGGDAQIRVHSDREGEPAFTSVRIARPHRLRVDRAGFHFDLE